MIKIIFEHSLNYNAFWIGDEYHIDFFEDTWIKSLDEPNINPTLICELYD